MIACIEEWLEAPLVVVGAGAAGLSAALASRGAMLLADTAPGKAGPARWPRAAWRRPWRPTTPPPTTWRTP
ncbi:MAG: hypothetical protein R2694_14620 [Ilumatobacteraceae bacterium]